MSLEEDCKDVLKHELKASEKISDIVDNNEWEDIDNAMLSVCSELVNKADDPERKKTILIIMVRIGQSVQSKDIVEFARDNLEAWKEKYD